jgi:hypothetical protein
VTLLLETGYTVQLDKKRAHAEWLTQNAERIAAAMPAGARYLGTYAIEFSTHQGGFFRTLVELDSHAVLGTLGEMGRDPDSDYGRIQGERAAFIDFSHISPWGNTLMRRLDGTPR